MSNKNGSNEPLSLKDMNDYGMNNYGMNNYGMKMGLNEFVGMEKHEKCEKIDSLEHMPIGMAYVPWQQWRCLYEPKDALKRGTLFEELDLPFEMAKECRS